MLDEFNQESSHTDCIQLKITQSKCTFEVYRDGHKILLNGIIRQPVPSTFNSGEEPWAEVFKGNSFLYYDLDFNIASTIDAKSKSVGFIHIAKTGNCSQVYLSIFKVCHQCNEEEFYIPLLTISEHNIKTSSNPGRYILNSPIIQTEQKAIPPTLRQ